MVILLAGCKDVIETDITHKKITVIAPLNNAKSTIYKQLFWWNEVDGATQYSIQIVSPSYDSLVSIVLDTIVKADRFYATLAPGKYQWRIRAENGVYNTDYQIYSLKMNPSALNLQTVNLTAPVNYTYQGASAGSRFDFKWDLLSRTTHYIIEIDTVTKNFVNPVLIDSTNFLPYSYTFTAEGDYKWRVMAKDSINGLQTAWSDIYYTGYYATAPGVPNPSTPANNQTVAPTKVTFTWSAMPKAKTYTLYLYRNGADTTIASTDKYPVNSPSASKSFFNATSGEVIYWRVSSTDKAGNQSALSSPTRKISIQ